MQPLVGSGGSRVGAGAAGAGGAAGRAGAGAGAFEAVMASEVGSSAHFDGSLPIRWLDRHTTQGTPESGGPGAGEVGDAGVPGAARELGEAAARVAVAAAAGALGDAAGSGDSGVLGDAGVFGACEGGSSAHFDGSLPIRWLDRHTTQGTPEPGGPGAGEAGHAGVPGAARELGEAAARVAAAAGALGDAGRPGAARELGEAAGSGVAGVFGVGEGGSSAHFDGSLPIRRFLPSSPQGTPGSGVLGADVAGVPEHDDDDPDLAAAVPVAGARVADGVTGVAAPFVQTAAPIPPAGGVPANLNPDSEISAPGHFDASLPVRGLERLVWQGTSEPGSDAQGVDTVRANAGVPGAAGVSAIGNAGVTTAAGLSVAVPVSGDSRVPVGAQTVSEVSGVSGNGGAGGGQVSPAHLDGSLNAGPLLPSNPQGTQQTGAIQALEPAQITVHSAAAQSAAAQPVPVQSALTAERALTAQPVPAQPLAPPAVPVRSAAAQPVPVQSALTAQAPAAQPEHTAQPAPAQPGAAQPVPTPPPTAQPVPAQPEHTTPPPTAQPAPILPFTPTLTPTPPTTPQSSPQPALAPQLATPLFSLASAAPGEHVMTMRVSPEDLGPLTVRAHIDGTGVRIELFAAGDAGREAVRHILPELRRGLEDSGASLSLSSHNSPPDAGKDGHGTGQGPGQGTGHGTGQGTGPGMGSRDPDAQSRHSSDTGANGADDQPQQRRQLPPGVVHDPSSPHRLDILV
ncbi:Flagellar hook-length control protein FliK [Arthrobacter sp. cf158]|uniref:flagellar hook-length control protein FliK n=1 Tax=Arthrobacter sp. cf158 TaxID=1761744 RepID=UPI000898BE3E|nr:flagellar hook-length control protein FliK [Arthrobacter sp. cf158]SDV99867.1 Flagellar hook-length control protein FliK [Arthrobacter sp. cf158]